MRTRIFFSGNSQAIRIPKAYRFDDWVTEVEIFRRGEELVIRPKPRSLAEVYDLLAQMPADFMQEGREEDGLPQQRDGF